jgi:hypothetical protein
MLDHREITFCNMQTCYGSSIIMHFCLFHSITRTFASGKTEKMIMQCLKELGFASGKVSIWKCLISDYSALK